MQVIAHCPKCDAGLLVTAAEAPESIKCGGCGHVLALAFTERFARDARVDVCPVCRGGDFYIRKDFDPKVGLTVVIIGALISAVFYWFGEDLIAYSILGGAALDRPVGLRPSRRRHRLLSLPQRVSRQIQRTATHFDLHTADVLEQEYERKIGRR